MTQTIGGGVEDLQALVSGQVIGPDHTDYDDARRVWNADIDGRPAVIARCVSAADVAATVTFARERALEIAVRGGAHSTPGHSTVNGGVVIDLSRMNQVAVDPVAKRAKAGGGALLADLDAATQAHGLAVPAGLVSHTGIGGLTLGGGMGWLTRLAGLTIDNLVSAEIVTADGRILRASLEQHPDLFWAIRGGGGNFGVVTEFEFRLHEVNPLARFGLLFWRADQGKEALRLAREVIPALPREINVVIGAMDAPPAPFVPEEHHFVPGYAVMVTGFGGDDSHANALARFREALPPLFEFATPLPYVEVQKLIDQSHDWGGHYHEKTCFVDDISDSVIDIVTEHVPRKNSPMSIVLFYRLDGAYSDVAEDATAFSGTRTPKYAVFPIGATPDAASLPAERSWVRALWNDLHPHATATGAYLNAMADLDVDRVLAAYGPAKYERLRRIKAEYDPHNVFHRNANITPGTEA